MKNWLSQILIALALMLATPLAASADTWQIDPVHSTIGFTVRHMTISSVKGQFDKFAGTITADGTDPHRPRSTRLSILRRSTRAPRIATPTSRAPTFSTSRSIRR